MSEEGILKASSKFVGTYASTHSEVNLMIEITSHSTDSFHHIVSLCPLERYLGGFNHQPSSYNLNVVRLCFQAFLQNSDGSQQFNVPLQPIVSEPIYDKKSKGDLVICKLSCASSPVDGSKEIILLCEKVRDFGILRICH